MGRADACRTGIALHPHGPNIIPQQPNPVQNLEDGTNLDTTGLSSLCRRGEAASASRRSDTAETEEAEDDAGFQAEAGPVDIWAGVRRTAAPAPPSSFWKEITAGYGVEVRAYCTNAGGSCLGLRREGTTAVMRVASFHAVSCSGGCESFPPLASSPIVQWWHDAGRILTKIQDLTRHP